MKKTKGLLAGLIIFLLIFTSCAPMDGGNSGKSNLDPNNPTTVTLWHYYVGENQNLLEEAVEEFNQTIGLDKGIIVQASGQGSIQDLEEKVTSSAKGVINSEPMPDIFSSYPDKAMEIDGLNKVVDLNKYFSSEEKDRYIPEFLNEGVFDEGRLLLIPIVKSTEILYMNDTAWKEFALSKGRDGSISSNWENLLKDSREYYQWMDQKTPDIPWDGKGMMGFDSLANFIILGSKQLGSEVMDSEIKGANLNKETLRKIFDIYCTGMGLGYFDAIGRYRADDVKSDEMIGYIGSTSGVSYFPIWIEKDNQRKDIDLVTAYYPSFEKTDSIAVQQGAGMCVSVSEPKKEEAAATFLKWFTNFERNIPFAMSTGYLPVEKEAYDSKLFKDKLDEYREGDQVLKNVAKAYDIALGQIMGGKTYAPKPFPGSYQIRTILQATLLEAGEKIKNDSQLWKQQGKTEEEILAGLGMDQRFNAWIDEVKNQLDTSKIPYKE